MASATTESESKLLTEAEIEQAKSEISGDPDDFQDATNGEPVANSDGNFEVSTEEINLIKAELASQYPEDCALMSDDYIESVASKPYSKDQTKRRPIEYSIQKLTEVLQWRKEAGVSDLIGMINLALGPENAPEALENSQRLTRAKAMATALNNGSQYFHGLTKDGRPILWVRTQRKFWYPDVDAELKALCLLVDAGCAAMPKGVTEFVVVSDSSSPPPPNPNYMIGVLKALVKGYPDRLGFLISAPVSSIIQFVMNLLRPLMPGRLNQKFILTDVVQIKEKLKDILPDGEEGIPVHFGGPVDHDELFPDDYNSTLKGKGSLKFDYFGMVERLQKDKAAFEAKNNLN